MKHLKAICWLLALAMVLGCSCAWGEEFRYEGDGFDTPEAAVSCYMEGLKNLDFEQMLSAYAWETQAEHYSVEANMSRMQAYSPAEYPRMPAVNDFLKTANLEALRYSEVRMIYNALEMYIMGENYTNGQTVALKEEGALEEFLKNFDNDRLEKLAGMSEVRFLSVDEVTGGRMEYERNQEYFKERTAQYGADETVNVVATADIDGGTVVCMPTVARYGEKWYMVSVSSMTALMLGTPMNNLALLLVEDMAEFGVH